MATMSLTNSAMIIKGEVVTRPQTPAHLTVTGVTLTATGKLAQVKLHGETLILQGVHFVTRPSGRESHLSRYLVGVCSRTGRLVEIFVEAVKGIQNALFKAKTVVQQALVGLFGRGLSAQQYVEAFR